MKTELYKRCSDCKEEKPISSFNKDKNKKHGVRGICVDCGKKRYKNYRYRNKEKIKAYFAKRHGAGREFIDKEKMSRGCFICGYCKCAAALDFHHKNPEDKKRNVGEMRGFSQETILEEMEKCIVLCSNCHKEFHAGMLVL